MSSAPPFPEASLRAVLAGAVAAWACAADDASAGDEPRRCLYLDAFAGAEFAFGTGVARTPSCVTRAAAVVDALRACARLAPPAACAFVEEDPAHLQRVYAELEDTVGGEHVHATRDLSALDAGDVALVEAPFAAAAAELCRTSAGARVFAFAAPPSARALPWDALRPVLALPDATVLIRFPHSDFEKQSRHTGPLADLPGYARRIVEGCSALLDDPKHAWLPAWRTDAGAGGAAPLARVLQRFREMVEGASAGRLVKPMHLETADGAAAWLLLVTPDPAVAMAANAAVRAAGLIDRAATSGTELAPVASPTETIEPAPVLPPERSTDDAAAPADTPEGAAQPSRPARRGGRRKQAPASSSPAAAPPDDVAPSSDDADGDDEQHTANANPPAAAEPRSLRTTVAPRAARPAEPRPVRPAPPPVAEPLDLFPEQIPTAPVPPSPLRPDATQLAATIEGRFAARTVTWRDVLAAFAASDVTPDELKAALAVLRRAGRAAYRALEPDDAEIAFPSEPPVRAKRARAKKKRTADDGLFAAGDEGESGAGGEGG